MLRRGGAQCFPNAHLARALRDRHEHDVHDPNAANDETHRGDPGEQHGERLRRLAQHAQEIRLVAHREVVRPVGARAMRAPDGALDLGHRHGHRILGADERPDVVDAVRAEDLEWAGLERDQNLLVGVTEARHSLLREHADDRERASGDPNPFVEQRVRIVGAEQRQDIGAKHRDFPMRVVFGCREHVRDRS